MNTDNQQRSEFADLTDRQAEVMDLVAQHLTSKEIGARLDIAHTTVDKHVEAARIKMNAPDRNAAARAWQAHLLRTERISNEFSPVDPVASIRQSDFRDLPTSPIFRVADAATFDGWQPVARRRPVLETLDERFGKWGRIGAVVVLAALLAVTAVLSLSIADGLDKLM